MHYFLLSSLPLTFLKKSLSALDREFLSCKTESIVIINFTYCMVYTISVCDTNCMIHTVYYHRILIDECFIIHSYYLHTHCSINES